MIVGMNDHVSRSLPVEDHNLLVMGDRVPSPARNPDLLCFDRCHICTVAGQVRKRTELYGIQFSGTDVQILSGETAESSVNGLDNLLIGNDERRIASVIL